MKSAELVESTPQQHRAEPQLRVIGKWAREAGPLIALILLVILGLLLNPSFLSWNNLSNVLTRSAFIGIISVGGTFVIVTGQIDLSVGAMAAFIASLMIIVMNQFANAGWSLPLAVGAGMVIGLMVGLLSGLGNGLLATMGKIDSFIVTLGTMGIFRSLVTFVANGGTLTLDSNIREAYRPVFYDSWLNVPIPVWVLALVVALGSVVLAKTRFGRYCRAVGSNAEVAHYSAIRVNRIRVIALNPDALPPWLTEADVDVYVDNFKRTCYRGGLKWYRNIDRNWQLLSPFSGSKVTVPAILIAGDRDVVLAFRGMDQVISNLRNDVPKLQKTLILPECGHWTQQERPQEVNEAMIEFLKLL